TVEGRVERAVFDLQDAVGRLLNMFGDLVSMGGAESQRTQDQHVERTLEQFEPVRRFVRHSVGRYSTLGLPIQGRRSTIEFVSSGILRAVAADAEAGVQ